MKLKKIRFIDLFAGIGGTRIGFEAACKKFGIKAKCVFTSEIKPYAIKVYNDNFPGEVVSGDITKIEAKDIPEFDWLLAGFPCQPFSSGGKRKGFMDTRGTLFFEIERILKKKSPTGFLLENVEGLVKHDQADKTKKIGRTLETILNRLELLGYQTNWALLDSKEFGVPQSRKRVYIVGTKTTNVPLEFEQSKPVYLEQILENGLPTMKNKLSKLLLNNYSINTLYGKSVKDKRGGANNIHSWDIELKGPTTEVQRQILNFLLKERRKKHWAEKKGITWMDGMPLTLDEIRTFFDIPNLKELLDDLVEKNYVKYEHPKDLVIESDNNGNKSTYRKQNENIEKGYNIVTGKLSFEINKILDPKDIAPTLVATDVDRLAVVDGKGLRKLSLREGLRLFGFPDTFTMNLKNRDGFDLLGNTVVINVVKAVSEKALGETY